MTTEAVGESKRKTAVFLRQHPLCAFCGGVRSATTVEHCPPRALFESRQWPVGFEFPSCEECNEGSRNEDLLIAVLARFDPGTDQRNQDGKATGLLLRANRQFPGLFENMRMSASEARRSNRELGIVPGPGQTHQDVCAIKVTPEINHAVRVFGGKLAKGIYYRETGNVFPADGSLLLNWFSNVDLVMHGKFLVFDALKELPGTLPPVTRSGRSLNDQFEYKLSLSSEQQLITLQARFGHSFGFVIFGSARYGILEDIVDRLKTQTASAGPFSFLQSKSHAED